MALFFKFIIFFRCSCSSVGFLSIFFADLGEDRTDLLPEVILLFYWSSTALILELSFWGDFLNGRALTFFWDIDLFLDLLRLGTFAPSILKRFLKEGLELILVSIIPSFLSIAGCEISNSIINSFVSKSEFKWENRAMRKIEECYRLIRCSNKAAMVNQWRYTSRSYRRLQTASCVRILSAQSAWFRVELETTIMLFKSWRITNISWKTLKYWPKLDILQIYVFCILLQITSRRPCKTCAKSKIFCRVLIEIVRL